MQPPAPYGTQTQFSRDGNWFWDGSRWTSTLSPDGRYRWTGTRWAPVRGMLLGDYANQSIACAILGILCGIAFALGLVAGYLAYRDLPWKRTQAIVGLVLNGTGLALWVLLLFLRAVGSAASH
jgi:hypothetical protein